MGNLKKLNNINTEGKTSAKPIPIIRKEQQEEVVSKTMRIYESDYERIREMAYKENKKMVEIASEAIELMYNSRNYDK